MARKNDLRIARRVTVGLSAVALVGVLAACGSTAGSETGQGYPSRNVTMLVPYAAGGPTDISARSLAKEMENELDTTIVVENRPGATGITGLSEVATSKADGYTLVLSTDDSFVQSVKRKTPYTFESFTPITGVFMQPYLLVVPKDSEIQEYSDLSSQKQLNYAVTGWSNPTHVNQAALYGSLGLEATAIPFDGAAPAAQAMLGGQTAISMLDSQAVMPYIKSGDLRAIAAFVPDGKRLDFLPDVPTFEELNVNTDDLTLTTYGLAAPAGVPEEVVTKVREAALNARQAESFTTFSADNFMPLLSDEEATKWYETLIAKSAATKAVMDEYNITTQ